MKRFNDGQGFTLPELIVAGAIIIGLTAAAFVLLRPIDRSAEQRDAERRLEVAQLAQALQRYRSASTNQALPISLSSEPTALGSAEGQINICERLVPSYLQDLPLDPLLEQFDDASRCMNEEGVYLTGYAIAADASGRVTVSAPLAETRVIALSL